MSESDYMAVECGVAARPLRGEIESGDLHAVIPRPGGTLIAVVDGLGHGYEAAVAARVAVITLTAQAHLPLLQLVKCCHEALIKTRGVAMSIALLERCDETMTWLSIGNVSGILLRANHEGSIEREYVLTRNGVVGHRLPPVRAATLRLHRGDLLVFATDGVREGFHNDVSLDACPQKTADRILAQHGKATDDALVLVGRWNGARAIEAA
jgi:serine phosphatase RsbU (regulator of sigma subunit)